jgi:hypothetical protein
LSARPSASAALPGRRAALVVAHPGHELRVHGWLERARPLVVVLTDGSGQSARSRLPASVRVLDAAGARPASVFGRFTDRALYDAMLAGDVAPFRALADEIAASLSDVDYVVADAAEGYNPAHDVCRLLADAAAARAGRARRRPLASFAFPLTGAPAGTAPLRPDDVDATLDDGAFARKLAAARGYPGLAAEVGHALDALGAEAFRREVLRRVGPETIAVPAVPFYERHGERRVAEGVYARVLCRDQHVRPIAEALACEC